LEKFSLLCFWLYGPLGFMLLRLEPDEIEADGKPKVDPIDRTLKLCAVTAWNLLVSILVIKFVPNLEDEDAFTACRVHGIDYEADLYSRYFGCSIITVAYFLLSFQTFATISARLTTSVEIHWAKNLLSALLLASFFVAWLLFFLIQPTQISHLLFLTKFSQDMAMILLGMMMMNAVVVAIIQKSIKCPKKKRIKIEQR